MICAALFGWLIARIDATWPAVVLAMLAGVVAVVSQAGDFFESGVKRHFGVKDTGSLIPGHGGALDRLDGLLLAVPFITLIYIFWGALLCLSPAGRRAEERRVWNEGVGTVGSRWSRHHTTK